MKGTDAPPVPIYTPPSQYQRVEVVPPLGNRPVSNWCPPFELCQIDYGTFECQGGLGLLGGPSSSMEQ